MLQEMANRRLLEKVKRDVSEYLKTLHFTKAQKLETFEVTFGLPMPIKRDDNGNLSPMTLGEMQDMLAYISTETAKMNPMRKCVVAVRNNDYVAPSLRKLPRIKPITRGRLDGLDMDSIERSKESYERKCSEVLLQDSKYMVICDIKDNTFETDGNRIVIKTLYETYGEIFALYFL